MLPLNPLADITNPSPYNCLSAFAGNYLYISPQQCVRDGFLSRSFLRDIPKSNSKSVDYQGVSLFKRAVVDEAFRHFKRKAEPADYAEFCNKNEGWLSSYCLFTALKDKFGTADWSRWDARWRKPERVKEKDIDKTMREAIERERFCQYLFFKQWYSLKRYCNERDIDIMGDISIYVAHDSSDVWANQKLFQLDKNGKSKFISGTPPDYYSTSGQLWGNPVYNWPAMKRDKYRWWVGRIIHNLGMFDISRIDHFRGFEAYWQVSGRARTAKNGKWVKGCGKALFDELLERESCPRIVVEDLGHITEPVRKLVADLGFPSMKILQFGFDGSKADNSHLPCNYGRNCVAYTGTHDNNTTRRWYTSELSTEQRKFFRKYIGKQCKADEVSWEVIRLAMASVADTVIVPAQDILGLSTKARMNRPGSDEGNWIWRLEAGKLDASVKRRLLAMTKTYGRC
jgi:4-alpha-glucanotransferase